MMVVRQQAPHLNLFLLGALVAAGNVASAAIRDVD